LQRHEGVACNQFDIFFLGWRGFGDCLDCFIKIHQKREPDSQASWIDYYLFIYHLNFSLLPGTPSIISLGKPAQRRRAKLQSLRSTVSSV
jgi:hypothetical protein